MKSDVEMLHERISRQMAEEIAQRVEASLIPVWNEAIEACATHIETEGGHIDHIAGELRELKRPE